MMQGLADELAGTECAALLIVAGSSRDPDMAPFVGASRLHESFVIAPAEGPLKLAYLSAHERGEAARTGLETLGPEVLEIARLEGLRPPSGGSPSVELWSSVLATGLDLAGVAGGRIAIAGRFENGSVFEALSALSERGFSFFSGHELMLRLRRRKKDHEVAEIRRVAAATASAFRRIAEILRHSEKRNGELWSGAGRLRTGDLRREVAICMSANGFEQPEGNIIAAAEEGAIPHNTGDDDRALRMGESIVVDLFPKGSLFADCSRTFCVGEPPEKLRRAFESVRTSLEWASGKASEGRAGSDLQSGVCEQLARAGHATPRHTVGSDGYLHGLGHGVGYEIHEYPTFQDHHGEDGVLRIGDVFTLEPGLYYPQEGFAVRLEDLFHLAPAGLENLTPLPYELDPAAWSG